MWYSYPDDWKELMLHGMEMDYSWRHPGQHYLNMYAHIWDA